MSTPLHRSDQLSLDVVPNPRLVEHQRETGEEPYLTGVLKVTGELHCPSDVNSGEELTIQVCDADGTVIAGGRLKALYPNFREIEDRGNVIGTERINRAKVA